MKKICQRLIGGCLLLLLVLTARLSAATTQSNFQVSPPPLPWFEFVKGQWDLRVGGNYSSITGKDAASGTEISIKGGGANFVARYAFTDHLAFDLGYNFLYLGGGVPNTFNLAMYMNSWNPNLEIQLVRAERVSWILFFGGLMSYTPAEFTDRTTSRVTSYGAQVFLAGPQFGTQLSLKAGSFAISPFVLLQSLSGTFTLSSPAYSASVPAFTMTSFGFDVTYVPWNITLSSVLNQATAATQNNGFNTVYFALSYDFRWEPTPAPAEPVTESEPVKRPPKKRR